MNPSFNVPHPKPVYSLSAEEARGLLNDAPIDVGIFIWKKGEIQDGDSISLPFPMVFKVITGQDFASLSADMPYESLIKTMNNKQAVFGVKPINQWKDAAPDYFNDEKMQAISQEYGFDADKLTLGYYPGQLITFGNGQLRIPLSAFAKHLDMERFREQMAGAHWVDKLQEGEAALEERKRHIRQAPADEVAGQMPNFKDYHKRADTAMFNVDMSGVNVARKWTEPHEIDTAYAPEDMMSCRADDLLAVAFPRRIRNETSPPARNRF